MGNICNKNISPVDKELLKSSNKSKIRDSNLASSSTSTTEGHNICPQDFVVKRKIGKGSFGKVFLVECKKDNQIYAMKVLEKAQIRDSDLVENSKVERIILSQVSFPFIVDLYYSFQTNKRLYLVTEYVSGGDLFQLMQKLSKFSGDQIKLYLAEILVSLEYLHKKNCIYRDLKPENILLQSDGHIKIIDFGLSKMFFGRSNEQRADSICGTAEYMAPEVVYDNSYSNTVDWFSLGAIAFFFFTGYTAYNCKDNPLNHIVKKNPLYYNPKIFDKVSEDFISRLLTYNPKLRLGANGINEIKDHPFFLGIDWNKVLSKEYQPQYVPGLKDSFVNLTLDDSCIARGLTEEIDSSRVSAQYKSKPTYDGFTYIKDTGLENKKSTEEN